MHHSMDIPYGFHSGYGMTKWLGCQPKNSPYGIHGIHPFHMESIWNPSGSVKYWGHQWCLPMKQPHLETSTLSPADIEQIVAQLEEAWQLLLDRIAHAEAEEAWITEEIASWEDIVYKSAALDIAQYRTKRIHST